MKQPSAARNLRCAIYTRVSTDQGLEQDFNSLDAQREAAEAYIKSQAHEGWRPQKGRYDDGGFSGASLDRPAMQRLLADIGARRIDVVVVYKVDRLTRALADFAKLVELFDAHQVSFVSVTQAFNTTTSMGRLTLNVLLSFAQFEREVTGERIRDKIAASKKKGIWVGGVVPLGYKVEERKLIVEPEEAATVRLIFELYLALGSLSALQRELRDRSIRTRRRTLSTGRTIGGVHLTNGPLAHLLRNRVYLGELNHRNRSYPGEHQAIVSQELFAEVQGRLDANRSERRQTQAASQALLLGRLFDDRDHPMTPTYAIKKGVRYRYYISAVLLQGRKEEAGSIPRVPAAEVEAAVVAALRSATGKEGEDQSNDRTLIEAHLQRASIGAKTIEIAWLDCDGESSSHILRVPFMPRSRHPKREIILCDSDPSKAARPIRAEMRNRLVASIALGRLWLRQIIQGEIESTDDLARREHKSERAIRTTLSLAFLAPDIARAAIDGRLPRGVGLSRLTDLPLDWSEQRQLIGLRT
jgi:DNA invertase Pin-like site-specific DNA recombinase